MLQAPLIQCHTSVSYTTCGSQKNSKMDSKLGDKFSDRKENHIIDIQADHGSNFRYRLAFPKDLQPPILYLFYHADLLEKCNRQGKKKPPPSAMGFLDDVNVLGLQHKQPKENHQKKPPPL